MFYLASSAFIFLVRRSGGLVCGRPGCWKAPQRSQIY